MKSCHALRGLLVVALGAQLGCSSKAVGPADLAAPEATEPLPLTLQVRSRVSGERLPALEVTGFAGSVRVVVERAAIGCTLGQAWVGRQPGVLTVVARVGGDPAALCLGDRVVEYTGLIAGVAPGRYTVHVYESVGDGSPVRLGTGTALVIP